MNRTCFTVLILSLLPVLSSVSLSGDKPAHDAISLCPRLAAG